MSNETCGACLLIMIRELDPLKPVSGVREGTGQLRPYVRPVARHLPLLCGVCRWPSWVCACVLGANLSGVLEAHDC